MPAHTYMNILNFSFLLFIKKWGTQENLGHTEEKQAGLPEAFCKTGMLVGLTLWQLAAGISALCWS